MIFFDPHRLRPWPQRPRALVLSLCLAFSGSLTSVALAQHRTAVAGTAQPPGPADGSHAEGQAWSWADLQAWSREQGPSVRLSRLKEHVASSNLQLVESDTGAQLLGAAGVARVKEPVTDTLNRRYERVHGQVGLRWSFLGAQEARQRNVLEAKADQLGTAAQTKLLEAQAITEIGRLYVRYLRSQQREQLVQTYLASRKSVSQRVQQRVAEGHMLRAEAMELQGHYEAAQARLAHEREVQKAALRQMGFLTGRHLRMQAAPALDLHAACMAPANLQDALQTHPALEPVRHAMQGVKEKATHTQFGGVEGGVQLSQNLSKDMGGSGGYSTAVGVDVTIPLEWRSQKQAMAAKLQGQYNEAVEVYEQTRQKLALEQQAALEQYRLRETEMATSAQRYAAAAESQRVVRLREPTVDGDGITGGIKARHAIYEAGMRYVGSAENRDLAAMDMQYFSVGCVLQPQAKDPVQAVVLPGGAKPPKAQSAHASGSPTRPSTPSLDDRTRAPRGTGWYAWQGQEWLLQPARIDQLPPGTSRVLISFTEAQLQALDTQPQRRNGLLQLMARAQQRGIQIELLLGEPTWVLPTGRGNMLALLKKVQTLPFSMVHLDLERSQLPKAQQDGWERLALETVREAASLSRQPISLTTHHRELQLPGFLDALQKAGVKEVIPMIYSANAKRTVDVIKALPPMPQGLDLAVAQSIEKVLPAEESRFRSGRKKSLEHWGDIAQALRTVPGFKGIVVQSWEDYMEAKP